MNDIRIGYFADGPWSHEAFRLLNNDKSISISFICVRYDTHDSTLKRYCDEFDISYLKHKNVNSDDFIDTVKKIDCDLFVSMSFNQIFKKEIINLPAMKTINCHAGKLPFYRGRNILNWALINDENYFGITVHYIDEGIDSGDIILQREYSITDSDDYGTLLKRAYKDCAVILYDAIKMMQSEKFSTVKQENIHPVGFYCTQRQEGDEKLNWNQSSRDIFNFVRALCKPGPISRSTLNNEEIKINRIELIEMAPVYKCIAGAVVGINKKGFVVKTADSSVLVTEYEYGGKIRIGDRLL